MASCNTESVGRARIINIIRESAWNAPAYLWQLSICAIGSAKTNSLLVAVCGSAVYSFVSDKWAQGLDKS